MAEYLDIRNDVIVGCAIPRTQKEAEDFEREVTVACKLIDSFSGIHTDWEIWSFSDNSKFKFYYDEYSNVYEILTSFHGPSEWTSIFQIEKSFHGRVSGKELNKLI